MNATPETDAQIKTFSSISKLKKPFVNRTGTVSADFARKLERERDEARAAWLDTFGRCNLCEQQLDEARAEVARLRERSKQWKLAAKDWRRFTFYMWRRYREALAAKEAAK